jgi:subtilisin-like proprotein convertase family protein
VVVNPNPPTPVITPAAPQICLGNSVQLTVPTPAATNATQVTASGSISVGVPDATAGGAATTLAISGIPSTATITSMSVRMNVTHTWVNDLVINLRAPNGRVLNLFNRKGGFAEQNLVNTVVSSASATPIPATGAPFTGTYAADAGQGVGATAHPSDAAGFADLYSVPNGNWILSLRDYVFFDAGTLTNWTITINYTYIPALTWTPITELFTNAAATTPYVAGTSAYTVYAKPTVTRTYTATSTGAGGCTATGTATVTVNPNPVVTIGSIPDTVCISDQVVPLVGNPVGGTWSGIGVSGNNFLPPTTAVGNYTLTYNYVNAFGCPGSATKQINVKDCPERIILLRDNAIVLFPNPTDGGRFNIRINSVLYNKLSMRVYTNNGQIVRTQQFAGLVYGRVVPIDLSALPGGTYIVKFAYEDAGPRTAEKSFKVIIGH